MDTLRDLYTSIGLQRPTTFIQSGNVVFQTKERKLDVIARKIEDVIKRSVGFRPDVVLRTHSEIRGVIERNPLARRSGIDGSKLLVLFLASEPTPESRIKLLTLKSDPEELHIVNREVYIYFPNGMARPKLPPGLVEKILEVRGTGRNWNTVTKLFEIAELMESGR